ncbi:protein of unknown function (plasmid) [Magnetospirillum sp. XM-1]|uniref:hypothetical protein n=1 Tax=Magnetospirillum sp. XM-1 TaxID=1663591 RepID=UPI00073E0AC5|nr:hypothetical protein [Magnetospirillum sp. XM-1]CUW41881.1 protein of unknown function [Magnetospirillum sp. XM-1]
MIPSILANILGAPKPPARSPFAVAKNQLDIRIDAGWTGRKSADEIRAWAEGHAKKSAERAGLDDASRADLVGYAVVRAMADLAWAV